MWFRERGRRGLTAAVVIALVGGGGWAGGLVLGAPARAADVTTAATAPTTTTIGLPTGTDTVDTTTTDTSTVTTTPSLTPPTTTSSAPDTSPQPVTIQVGSTQAAGPLPAGFLGFSIEFNALHAYLGRNPRALDPVFLQLLSGVAQGHYPVLRVGGNSSDDTWSPLPGVIPPLGVSYGLTPDWLATVHALAQKLHPRFILGVNLAADDPQMGAVMARALVNGIGARYIEDLEVGNEPDLYLRYTWFTSPNQGTVTRRVGSYSYRSYVTDLSHWIALLPHLPLAGGVLATLNWLPQLAPTANRFRGLDMVTAHRYALTNCGVAPTSPIFPTIPNLLSTAATSGLAAPLAPYAQQLHAEGINFRIDELNSASCEGAVGVSNTFASALWILDELFDMARAGVDGVNIHTLPGSNYAPFTFARVGGQWIASVRPLYYGMLAFTRGFPPGAFLLTSTDSSADTGGDVKSFTTQSGDGTLRTTIINEDPRRPAAVSLSLPSDRTMTATALTAPSLSATSGVSLGGVSFPDPTTSGTLPPAQSSVPITPVGTTYTLQVPPGAAVLLTGPGGP